MLDLLILFQPIIDSLQGLLTGDASTTTYLILALIPVCILIAIREIWCWFIKQNKLVSKMEKIEKQLKKTNQLLEGLGNELREDRVAQVNGAPSKEFVPSTPKNYDRPSTQEHPEVRTEPKSLGDRKFSL